jgi:hypothetical protein
MLGFNIYELILQDYYRQEKETEEVTELICKLLNIKAEHKEEIFKQSDQQKQPLNK